MLEFGSLMAVGSGLWTPERRSGPGACGDVCVVSIQAGSRRVVGLPVLPTSLDSGDRGETGKGTKDLQKLVPGGQGSCSHSCVIPTFSL